MNKDEKETLRLLNSLNYFEVIYSDSDITWMTKHRLEMKADHIFKVKDKIHASSFKSK